MPLTDKPHYLSVDIDYWTNSSSVRMLFELGKLIEDCRAAPAPVPITAVMNHQQLLWNVNRTSARRLVNLDYHSDISDKDATELHCGNWVSYVTWRRDGEYIWVRPEIDPSLGACNDSGWDKGSDWKKVTSTVRAPSKLSLRKLLRNCKGIGLCMSPAFVRLEARALFTAVIKEYKIPYRPGDVTEHISVKRRPS